MGVLGTGDDGKQFQMLLQTLEPELMVEDEQDALVVVSPHPAFAKA